MYSLNVSLQMFSIGSFTAAGTMVTLISGLRDVIWCANGARDFVENTARAAAMSTPNK